MTLSNDVSFFTNTQMQIALKRSKLPYEKVKLKTNACYKEKTGQINTLRCVSVETFVLEIILVTNKLLPGRASTIIWNPPTFEFFKFSLEIMHVLGIAIVKNCFGVTEDILYPLFGALIGSRNVAFYCGLLNLTTKIL